MMQVSNEEVAAIVQRGLQVLITITTKSVIMR